MRQQQTPQWGVGATERSALADGGASPRQVLRKDYTVNRNEQRQGIIVAVVSCLLLVWEFRLVRKFLVYVEKLFLL